MYISKNAEFINTPMSAPVVTVSGIAMMIGIIRAFGVFANRVQSETRTVPPVYAPATELILVIIANPLSTLLMGIAELRELRSDPAPPFA